MFLWSMKRHRFGNVGLGPKFLQTHILVFFPWFCAFRYMGAVLFINNMGIYSPALNKGTPHPGFLGRFCCFPQSDLMVLCFAVPEMRVRLF